MSQPDGIDGAALAASTGVLYPHPRGIWQRTLPRPVRILPPCEELHAGITCQQYGTAPPVACAAGRDLRHPALDDFRAPCPAEGDSTVVGESGRVYPMCTRHVAAVRALTRVGAIDQTGGCTT